MRDSQKAEQFFGGKLETTYDVIGIYRTAEETKQYRRDQVDYGTVVVPPLYNEPIAWMVRQHEGWGARPYIDASGGGPIRKPDEDYVLAVFEKYEEAKAYLAIVEADEKAWRESQPEWRTLPDNCANCEHPKVWHMGEGQCIWEDDVDSHGRWTLCLKACYEYERPEQK